MQSTMVGRRAGSSLRQRAPQALPYTPVVRAAGRKLGQGGAGRGRSLWQRMRATSTDLQLCHASQRLGALHGGGALHGVLA